MHGNLLFGSEIFKMPSHRKFSLTLYAKMTLLIHLLMSGHFMSLLCVLLIGVVN